MSGNPTGGFLIADDREPPGVLHDVLRDIPGSSVARLSIGDFVIHDACEHTLVVERKEVSDLVHSIADGRLHTQIGNMAAFDHSLLLIEGHWLMNGDKLLLLPKASGGFRTSKWKAHAVQMLLLGTQRANPELIVLHTSGIEETIATLKSLEMRARRGCVLQSKGDCAE